MALNNIALKNGPAPGNIFPALSNIASCDHAYNGLATPTTAGLVFSKQQVEPLD